MPTNNVRDELTQELEELLAAQSLEKISQWENTLYDELAGSLSNSLVLFGAGGLGRKTLKGLRSIGVEPLAFTDNNASLHGRKIDGLNVLPPTQAAHEFGKNAIFLVAVYTDSAPGGIEPIKKDLTKLGCQMILSFVPLYWKYPDQFLPHYVYDLPHKLIESAASIRKTWSLLSDDTSRNEYLAQIHWRLDPEYDQIPEQAKHEIYFPPDLIKLNENEVFVDCGAYDGDTVRSLLQQTKGNFKKLLAFEPDPANYKKLWDLTTSLPQDICQRIETSEVALGRQSEQLNFEAQGIASSFLSTNGSVQIQSESLDFLLADESPTYIKMDIEGAEIEALIGAYEMIRKHLPILAISVYHHQDHIWSIPLMIHSLSNEYKFYLRRYTARFLDDLVLYAIPAHRRLV
jgi:FkbM family methyltransferase